MQKIYFYTPDYHRELLDNKPTQVDAGPMLNPWIFKKDEP